jgi:hypothetical protein
VRTSNNSWVAVLRKAVGVGRGLDLEPALLGHRRQARRNASRNRQGCLVGLPLEVQPDVCGVRVRVRVRVVRISARV